jgi:hypothetical protein
MSRQLYPTTQYGVRSSGRNIDEANINDRGLVEGQEITVWSVQVPADKAYHWGIGANNRNAGNANFVYAEFLADGTGSGTDGDVIRAADVVLAVTDSTQENTLAKVTLTESAGELADAKADPRSERPLLPELAPAASEDRHLELRLRAQSAADGVVVGNDSDVALKYGEV